MKKGYIVIERAEDFEQMLCLATGKNLPPKGILTWHDKGAFGHVFPSRAEAHDAINRTHHFAKAFCLKSYPEKSSCMVVAVKIQEAAA